MSDDASLTEATPLMIAATIDVSDLEIAAGFYSELLGLEVMGIIDPFAFLSAAETRKVAIWLQKVPEEKAGKNRCHLDFVSNDLESTEKRIIALGGSLGERQSWQEYLWRTCFDPDGNEFDVMQAQNV
ncbi:MAG: VOC family protein [Acidimicrobiia bacterium]|nr:VOC family protein [Acidimicrobiia bacterium]